MGWTFFSCGLRNNLVIFKLLSWDLEEDDRFPFTSSVGGGWSLVVKALGGGFGNAKKNIPQLVCGSGEWESWGVTKKGMNGVWWAISKLKAVPTLWTAMTRPNILFLGQLFHLHSKNTVAKANCANNMNVNNHNHNYNF